jgi:Phage integrase family
MYFRDSPVISLNSGTVTSPRFVRNATSFSWINLRHSAISLLLNSGADPFAVQKLAGHSDVRLTTQTYAHVQAEALRRAAGVLDRICLEGNGSQAVAQSQTTAS